MKKKVLSKEALALMLGAEENVETVAEVVETVEETVEAVEETVEAVEEVVEDEGPSALEVLQAEFDAFKLSSEASTITATEALATVETNATELKAIVTDQVSKMRLALKLPPVDMTAWDSAGVVTEFNSTRDSFVSSFPVGSVIPEKKKEDKETKADETSYNVSAKKSLGF